MTFPLTRAQLVNAIANTGYDVQAADRLVNDLVGSGRISLSGSMIVIQNPTDYDAGVLVGLCRAARGGTAGGVSNYKVREYLENLTRLAAQRGQSAHV